MRIRNPGSNAVHPRIKRVEAHGVREAFDSWLRLARPVLYPTTSEPRIGQIGIEQKRAIDQGGPLLKSPTTLASAHPLLAIAIASSFPNSTARPASLLTSAISPAVPKIQLKPLA